MRKLTVIIDSREKKGYELPFPTNMQVHLRRSKLPTLVRVNTTVETLDAGDYTLKGFRDVVLVETKRSAREVADNLLTKDYRRASAAFERFKAASKYPLLVCEFGMAELFTEDKKRPGLVDGLCHEVARLGVSFFFAGPRSALDARRRTAEFVLRMMLTRVEMDFPLLVWST